jgi:hypothetical protein
MSVDTSARGLALAARTIALRATGAAYKPERLRDWRLRRRKLDTATAETTQAIIGILGNSYVAGDYWTPIFAKTLQDRYGSAGIGWVGFGFYGTGSAPPFTTGGTQPNFGGTSTVDGNIRPDIVAKPTFDGTWTCSYNSAGSNLPSLSYATSSTVGDQAWITFPSGHSSARLFYFGATATGSFRYSWDSGSNWIATISTTANANGLSAALSSVPGTSGTLLIEVVSGTVNLGGVDFKSTAAGVRVHKLGVSGSATNTWSSTSSSIYPARLAELLCTTILIDLDINDRGNNFAPAGLHTTQLQAIINRVRTAYPYADIGLISSQEDNRVGLTYAQSLYAAANLELASTNNLAHLNMQEFFGTANADYAAANPSRAWMAADLIHPVALTGGRVYADAVLGFIDVR